jgi:hypothetical protein
VLQNFHGVCSRHRLGRPAALTCDLLCCAASCCALLLSQVRQSLGPSDDIEAGTKALLAQEGVAEEDFSLEVCDTTNSSFTYCVGRLASLPGAALRRTRSVTGNLRCAHKPPRFCMRASAPWDRTGRCEDSAPAFQTLWHSLVVSLSPPVPHLTPGPCRCTPACPRCPGASQQQTWLTVLTSPPGASSA